MKTMLGMGCHIGGSAIFAMNDKCAAGTGKSLETMAGILGVNLTELGPLALTSNKPVILSNICTVFIKFEVMCMLLDGKSRADIASGLALAMAHRMDTSTLVRREEGPLDIKFFSYDFFNRPGSFGPSEKLPS